MSGNGEPKFTTADEVALTAIECGLSLQPWQFDYLDAIFAGPVALSRRPPCRCAQCASRRE